MSTAITLVVAAVWLFAYMSRPNEIAESDLGWTVAPWIATLIGAVVLGALS